MPSPLPVNNKLRAGARFHKLLVLAATATILLSACSGTAESTPVAASQPSALPPPDPSAVPADRPAAGGVSFSKDVLPILQSRCVNCHGGQRTEKNLRMTSYDNLMAGSEKGMVVVPGDVDNSSFIQLLLQGKMPKRGPKLLPDQVQLLTDWVEAGALNN